MKRANIPFNIRLLKLTPDKLKLIKPVTSLDIFDQSKEKYHPEGLYSTEIFGRVGDPLRDKRFSYIDIKIPIFHPVVFRSIERVKSLYGEIISGTSYAVWDSDIRDFVKSTKTEGSTGYHFFMKHFNDINYVENDSASRIEAIKLIKTSGLSSMVDKIVVLPAGLREIEYENDRVTEDEINDYYRRLLSISNSISGNTVKSSPELLDRSRLFLQRTFNELYDYIESMLEGKKKFILGKWASRRIFNSTRNVLTAMPVKMKTLGDGDNPNITDVYLGLFQLMKANLPVTKYMLRTGFLSKVFTSATAPVRLVNKKTLEIEELNLDSSYFDFYMTDEGQDKLLNLFGEESLRHVPVEIEGRYLGLIYKGPDGTFKLFQDINELPANRNKEDVSPITLAELLYCSTYKRIEDVRASITRDPLTGVESLRWTKPKLVTTVTNEVRTELGEDWTEGGEENVASSFPIRGLEFMNTQAPSSFSLSGMGADEKINY